MVLNTRPPRAVEPEPEDEEAEEVEDDGEEDVAGEGVSEKFEDWRTEN